MVHPGGLEPPCREAAASEAAASAVSPRVQCWCRNGGSNAGFRLTKAVPCHWTIATWRWLEDSNLPPLAYEASALPDELSQRMKLTKGSRRRSRSGSDLVGAPDSAPRPNLDVHNVKEPGATGAVVVHAHSRSR